ncbi:hypothetical protein LINGRAPRIM_LOCUS371 [Linum grandiflorum]
MTCVFSDLGSLGIMGPRNIDLIARCATHLGFRPSRRVRNCISLI